MTIASPLVYYDPADDNREYPVDVTLALVIDSESGDLVSETYYANDDSGAVAEATLDPGGLITPKLVNIDARGNQEWFPSDQELYADLDTLSLDFVPLASGIELQMDLEIYDYGGNANYSYLNVEVP